MIKICGRLWIISVFSILLASEGTPEASHSSFDVTGIEKQLTFSNSGYELIEVIQNGITYIKPEIHGSGSRAESGEPDFPTLSTFYAVEPGKSFAVQISI